MPDSFHLRPAVPSDSEGIAKVHTRSWQSAYRGILPDDWLADLKWQDRKERWDRQLPTQSPRAIYVATNSQNEIVGFASIGPARDEDLDPEEFFELYAIYLSPDTWRNGLGSRLLSAVLEQIPSKFRQLTLWVLTENLQGRSFYEKSGFVKYGAAKMADILGHQREEIRYRLELQENQVR